MFSDSIYQILHLKTLKNHAKLQKRGLLISEFPDLQVYTVKTPLIGWISIKTVFLVPKTVLLEESLHHVHHIPTTNPESTNLELLLFHCCSNEKINPS
jgi:hypothetical protein